jgi:hypothetical protein
MLNVFEIIPRQAFGKGTMQTFTQVQPELTHLDAVIKDLKRSGEGELLVEHLQTAHAYLHGAMPMECHHNLQLAQGASDVLSDQRLKHEVKMAIGGLLRALGSAPGHDPRLHQRPADNAPPVNAKGIAKFFHGADTSFGIFYPKKHVVAVFPSFDLALCGYQILSSAGFRMWEIIAVPGEEAERFLECIRMNRTLWDELVREVSVFLDTEANLVDRYAHWARCNYGFLVARSTDSDAAERIAKLLDPLDPIAMHWFMSGYIRHLTEGN